MTGEKDEDVPAENSGQPFGVKNDWNKFEINNKPFNNKMSITKPCLRPLVASKICSAITKHIPEAEQEVCCTP